MKLEESLKELADYLCVPCEDLLEFANEDSVGGFPESWPCGSMWEVEGKTIYSLIRAFKPTRILELGVNFGCSSTHILSAISENDHGKLCSVDIMVGSGKLVPERFRRDWFVENADAFKFIKNVKSVDFIFEDLMHSTEQVEKIAKFAIESLTPGGFLVCHDAMHPTVGKEVKLGLSNAGLNPLYILAEPSDCGLAIWRKSCQ